MDTTEYILYEEFSPVNSAPSLCVASSDNMQPFDKLTEPISDTIISACRESVNNTTTTGKVPVILLDREKYIYGVKCHKTSEGYILSSNKNVNNGSFISAIEESSNSFHTSANISSLSNINLLKSPKPSLTNLSLDHAVADQLSAKLSSCLNEQSVNPEKSAKLELWEGCNSMSSDITANSGKKLVSHPNKKVLDVKNSSVSNVDSHSKSVPIKSSNSKFRHKKKYAQHKKAVIIDNGNQIHDATVPAYLNLNIQNLEEKQIKSSKKLKTTNPSVGGSIIQLDSLANSSEKFKYEMRWQCLCCSQEFSTSLHLNKHYVSHSKEDIASTLFRLTKPFYLKLASKNNSQKKSVVPVPVISNEKTYSKSKATRTSCTENLQPDSSTCNSYISNKEDKKQQVLRTQRVLQTKPTKIETTEIGNLECVQSDPASPKLHNSEQKKEKSGRSRDPHECLICHKILCSRGNLSKHLILHQAKKPWTCETCSAGFNSKRNFKFHYLQKHTNIRPFVCKICGKGYASSRYLNEHSAFHSSKKAFKCDLCEKSFVTAKCLKRHVTRHNPLKRFTCQLCPKSFKVHNDLKAHMKIVHKTKSKCKKYLTTQLKDGSCPPKVETVSNTTMDIDKSSSALVPAIEPQIKPSTYVPDIKDVTEIFVPTESTVILPEICELTKANNINRDHFYTTDGDFVNSLIPVSNTIDSQNCKFNFETVKNRLEPETSFVMVGLDLGADESQIISTNQVLNSSQGLPLYYDLLTLNGNKLEEIQNLETSRTSPVNALSKAEQDKVNNESLSKTLQSSQKTNIEVFHLAPVDSESTLQEKLTATMAPYATSSSTVRRSVVEVSHQDINLELLSQTLNL